jgi:hypothetical protein
MKTVPRGPFKAPLTNPIKPGNSGASWQITQ